jgi:hypothetical protein
MSSLPIPTHDNASEKRQFALNHLRQGGNPFSLQVAAISTSEASLNAGASEFAANQLEELLEIVSFYRDSKTPTRAYPILGDRGSGKTHLIYTLRNELRRRALESSDEAMVIVLERFSPGTDAVDYLFWQIVNYLMNKRGDGDRLLSVIAGRVAARLLAESLRRLTPPQRVELIPPKGWLDSVFLRLGNISRTRERLEGIEKVLEICDGKKPTSEELREACLSVALPLSTATQIIDQHLERSESKDILGWFRKNLYSRLARLALLEDRDPFEELHNGDYEQAPSTVQHAGTISHRFLEVWLELLFALSIPAVVIFDQLEDYLRAVDEENVRRNRKFFTNAVCNFVNELRHVCVLVFAEQALWSNLLNEAEPYAAERLKQPFSLNGRAAQRHILMPDQLSPEVFTKIVQQRIRSNFPSLDLTGLPPHFPFQDSDVLEICKEPSIRMGLQKLSQRFDDIVFRTRKINLSERLSTLWNEQMSAAEAELGSDLNLGVSNIPDLQNALQGWLDSLEANGLMGQIPWKKAELLNEPSSQPYGCLCVVRTDGLHDPGIGVGIWLGRRNVQRKDLVERIQFFKHNPCPIRTLIMLRIDSEKVLVGETKLAYEKAIKAKRDIRIQKYEPQFLYALKAFSSWDKAAKEEVNATSGTIANAAQIYRDFLAEISKGLIGLIDEWRQPTKSSNGGLFYE